MKALRAVFRPVSMAQEHTIPFGPLGRATSKAAFGSFEI